MGLPSSLTWNSQKKKKSPTYTLRLTPYALIHTHYYLYVVVYEYYVSLQPYTLLHTHYHTHYYIHITTSGCPPAIPAPSAGHLHTHYYTHITTNTYLHTHYYLLRTHTYIHIPTYTLLHTHYHLLCCCLHKLCFPPAIPAPSAGGARTPARYTYVYVGMC